MHPTNHLQITKGNTVTVPQVPGEQTRHFVSDKVRSGFSVTSFHDASSDSQHEEARIQRSHQNNQPVVFKTFKVRKRKI